MCSFLNFTYIPIRRIQISAQIQMKKKKSHKLMCNMLLLLIFFMIFITFLPKFNMGCARSTSYHGNIMKRLKNEAITKSGIFNNGIPIVTELKKLRDLLLLWTNK